MTTTTVPTSVPLQDSVLAILSLASLQGQPHIPIDKVWWGFARVIERNSEAFPPVVFEMGISTVYSRGFESALGALLPYSVVMPTPGTIGVPQLAAQRHLDWLREQHGDKFIATMTSLAEEFVSELSESG